MSLESELAEARKEVALQRLTTALVARGLAVADAEEATKSNSHRVLIREHGGIQLIDSEGETEKRGLDAFADSLVASRKAALEKPKRGQPTFEPNRQEGSPASSADPDEVAALMRRVDYGI